MAKLTYNRTRKLKHLLKYMLKMLDATCYFCHESLIEADLLKITVHHINEDHDDDRKENLSLAHECCHRRHHAKIILHGKRQ